MALQPKRKKPQIYADSRKQGPECLNPAVICEICGFF